MALMGVRTKSQVLAELACGPVCINSKCIVMDGMDGKRYKAPMRCHRTDPCDACRAHRANMLFAMYHDVIEDFRDPYFLTLTFDSSRDYGMGANPHGLAPEPTVKESVYAHRTAWPKFARKYLAGAKYIRATEFVGINNRVHIHLVIDRATVKKSPWTGSCMIPRVDTKKNESLQAWIARIANRIDPTALMMYQDIRNMGLGKFDCTPVKKTSKAIGYLTNYATKPLPDIFREPELANFRTWHVSPACNKTEFEKRHCYKLSHIADSSKQDTSMYEETLLPQITDYPESERPAIRQMDAEFQMDRCKDSLPFRCVVKQYAHARKEYTQVKAKLTKPEKEFCRFWTDWFIVKCRRKLLCPISHIFDMARRRCHLFNVRYNSRISEFVLHDFIMRELLDMIRTKFNYSGTLRFLLEIIAPAPKTEIGKYSKGEIISCKDAIHIPQDPAQHTLAIYSMDAMPHNEIPLLQ